MIEWVEPLSQIGTQLAVKGANGDWIRQNQTQASGTKFAVAGLMAVVIVSWVCFSCLFCMAFLRAAVRARPRHPLDPMEPAQSDGIGANSKTVEKNQQMAQSTTQVPVACSVK
jgi:hypothetical protein